MTQYIHFHTVWYGTSDHGDDNGDDKYITLGNDKVVKINVLKKDISKILWSLTNEPNVLFLGEFYIPKTNKLDNDKNKDKDKGNDNTNDTKSHICN